MTFRPLPNTYVMDASVGIKWVINEEHSSRADQLLNDKNRLLVPDRFYSEIANVLWKRTRRQKSEDKISVSDARDGLQTVLGFLSLEPTPSADLVHDALEMALDMSCSSYDCEYVVLALRESALFVTADRKLYNAIGSHPRFGPLVLWIDHV